MTKIYKPLPEVHYRPLPDYLTIKKSDVEGLGVFATKRIKSNKINAFSKPELNINNEDVICTHGCTIGALDENHLFYLQHRGLTYE